MTVTEFESIMQKRASDAEALSQKEADERNRSILLMQASMYRDMLTVLGKRELQGHRGTLSRILKTLEERHSLYMEKEDFDAADREKIKMETVKQVIGLVSGEA